MKISEIIRKIEDGTMKINLHGHGRISSGSDALMQLRVLGQLKESLESQIAVMNDWKERDDVSNIYAEEKLASFNSAQAIVSLPDECAATITFSFHCQHCGQHYGLLTCEDDNMLSYTNTDLSSAESCQFKDGVGDAESDVCINIPSGNLLIFNHLGREFADKPKEKQFKMEYALGTTQGRRNIAAFLANKNIGFVQDRSGIAYIFQSPDKKHLIFSCIGPDEYLDFLAEIEANKYTADEIQSELHAVDEYQTAILKLGYEFVGELDMEVWRWMCADQEVLKELNVSVPEHVDMLQLTVPKGRWQIRSFHHLHETSSITAEMRLK